MHFGLWQILVLICVVLGFINHVFVSGKAAPEGKAAYAIGGILGYGAFLFFLFRAGTFN